MEPWIQKQWLIYYQEGVLEGQGDLEGTGTKPRERTRLEGSHPSLQVTVQPLGVCRTVPLVSYAGVSLGSPVHMCPVRYCMLPVVKAHV